MTSDATTPPTDAPPPETLADNATRLRRVETMTVLGAIGGLALGGFIFSRLLHIWALLRPLFASRGETSASRDSMFAIRLAEGYLPRSKPLEAGDLYRDARFVASNVRLVFAAYIVWLIEICVIAVAAVAVGTNRPFN